MTDNLLLATYRKYKTVLENNGFLVNPFKNIAYGIQFPVSFQGRKETVRIYNGKKGLKIDLSPVSAGDIRERIAFLTGIREKKPDFSKTNIPESDIIGTDESGKGDYFGPLVVAAVYMDEKTNKVFRDGGIRDCKAVTDKRIPELAEIIQDSAPFTLVSLTPETYNKQYDQFKNLNELLAGMHAQAIEDLRENTGCSVALTDQFCSETVLKRHLKDPAVTLHLRVRAESHPAVAAASIIARNHFLKEMDRLSVQIEMELPKGNSNAVIKAGKHIRETLGAKTLSRFAKVHFKTTEKILYPDIS